jgi:hypothetical protein
MLGSADSEAGLGATATAILCVPAGGGERRGRRGLVSQRPPGSPSPPLTTRLVSGSL